MQVGLKDKRLKALNAVPATVPDEELNIAGLRPLDAAAIRNIIAILSASTNLPEVSTAHPQWRVHHHRPRKASSPWSIDVSGNWRLLFEYDKKTATISGLRLEDPH
jgi:plasmid maintenance system killer protein